MSTINGIGTMLYGISEIDNEGNITATTWVTFLYLPLFPLWKDRLKRKVTKPYEYTYSIIRKESIEISEVIKTYLWGRILIPLLIFGPSLLNISELQQILGFTIIKNGFFIGRFGTFQIALTKAAIAAFYGRIILRALRGPS
jgi:hypothetical protein